MISGWSWTQSFNDSESRSTSKTKSYIIRYSSCLRAVLLVTLFIHLATTKVTTVVASHDHFHPELLSSLLLTDDDIDKDVSINGMKETSNHQDHIPKPPKFLTDINEERATPTTATTTTTTSESTHRSISRLTPDVSQQCWYTAIRRIRFIQQHQQQKTKNHDGRNDDDDDDADDERYRSNSNHNNDLISICTHLSNVQLQRLVLDISYCHMKDVNRMMYETQYIQNICTVSTTSTTDQHSYHNNEKNIDVDSNIDKIEYITTTKMIQYCLHHLNDMGYQTYTYFLPYVEMTCTKKAQEMYLYEQYNTIIEEIIRTTTMKYEQQQQEQQEYIDRFIQTSTNQLLQSYSTQMIQNIHDEIITKLQQYMLTILQEQLDVSNHYIHSIIQDKIHDSNIYIMNNITKYIEQQNIVYYNTIINHTNHSITIPLQQSIYEMKIMLQDQYEKNNNNNSFIYYGIHLLRYYVIPSVLYMTQSVISFILVYGYTIFISFGLYYICLFMVLRVMTRRFYHPLLSKSLRYYLFGIVTIEIVIEVILFCIIVSSSFSSTNEQQLQHHTKHRIYLLHLYLNILREYVLLFIGIVCIVRFVVFLMQKVQLMLITLIKNNKSHTHQDVEEEVMDILMLKQQNDLISSSTVAEAEIDTMMNENDVLPHSKSKSVMLSKDDSKLTLNRPPTVRNHVLDKNIDYRNLNLLKASLICIDERQHDNVNSNILLSNKNELIPDTSDYRMSTKFVPIVTYTQVNRNIIERTNCNKNMYIIDNVIEPNQNNCVTIHEGNISDVGICKNNKIYPAQAHEQNSVTSHDMEWNILQSDNDNSINATNTKKVSQLKRKATSYHVVQDERRLKQRIIFHKKSIE